MDLQLYSPDPVIGMFYYHQFLGDEFPKARQATLPDPPLLLGGNTKLTLPPIADNGQKKCSNSTPRHDMWMTPPTKVTPEVYRDVGFLTHLGLFCAAAKVRDCTNTYCRKVFEIMDKAAPPCNWTAFRHWALVAMSCQSTLAASYNERLAKPRKGETFTSEVRMSRPHTHLVYAAHGCFWVLENSREVRPLFQPTHDGFSSSSSVDLRAVCNVIYWMANVQAFKDLGVTFSRRWDHHYLVPEVALPPIWQAARKIRNLNLCSCRFWNFVNLAERKQSDLPDIIYTLEQSSRRDTLKHFDTHSDDRSNHDDCAPTKCQYSHKDSTSAKQLHKCEYSDCEQSEYPVELLTTAVELGEGTVWSRSAPKLSAPGIPYIAISHVWSDGTGVGLSSQGRVNQCLFGYFACIAESLNCDGIWWDALSIPLEPKARAKAISQMHKNYADAEYTVVHDQYLLGIEYTDRETACLAIALSPWFTRGWTALELRMSNRVKVLFKGTSSANPDIKDLDDDILAKDPGTVSRTHWLASLMISRLRSATIEYIDDVLAILRPRSTSWVRDRTVIAGLLLRIPRLDVTRSESEITRAIIRHIGRVPYSALLHGMPTMSDVGSFSWCPPTLDDMPIDLTTDLNKRNAREVRMLHVSEKGAVTGRWYCEAVTERHIKNKMLKPHGVHISVAVHFYNALLHWENCLILRERKGDPDPALLVVAVRLEKEGSFIDCEYVGAVRVSEDDSNEGHFNDTNVKNGDGKDLRSVYAGVRIGNENGQPDRASHDDVANWLKYCGDSDESTLSSSVLERSKLLRDKLPSTQLIEKPEEYFKKRPKGVGSPWYEARGVKQYSPPKKAENEELDNDSLEPTENGRLLRAFQSEHAENLIHLFVSRGVVISVDIENALTFNDLIVLSRACLQHNIPTEAQRTCKRATQMLRKARNADELSSLETIGILAKVCWKVGLFDEAKDVYLHIISKCDLETSQQQGIRYRAIGELSLLLAGINQMDEASKWYQCGLRKFNPPDSVYAFGYHTMSRMQIPYSQRHAIDLEEEKMYKSALRELEKEAGSKHAITLITYLNLAGAILRQGEVAEAEEILNGVIRDLEKDVGDAHLLTSYAKLEVARLHILQGRIITRDQVNSSLPKCNGSLDQQHFLNRLTNLTIGRAYEKLSLLDDDAVPFLQRAQECPTNLHDSTGVYLAACAKRDLGIVYARLGRLDEAQENYQESLKMLRRPSHPESETVEVFVTLFCLGCLKVRKGAPSDLDAKQMFRESLEGLERLCGPTNLETREIVNKLGRLCKPMVVEVDEAAESYNGDILQAVHGLSQLLERYGDGEESRVRVERAFDEYDGFFTAPRQYPLEPDDCQEAVNSELQDNEILVRVVAAAIYKVNCNDQDSDFDSESDDFSSNLTIDDYIEVEDVAGEVIRVGGKTGFQKGDRILGHAVYSATHDTRHIGFRKQTVLLSNMASRIPRTLTFEDAAVLPLGLSTAAAALFQDGFLELPPPSLQPEWMKNQAVLVIEGTTSAGTNAIQLATAAGCRVITTALPKNFDYVKELGARQVVDSRSPTVVDDLTNAFGGDRIVGIFDTSGSEDTMRTAITILRKVPGKKIVVSVSDKRTEVSSEIVHKIVTATAIKDNHVSKMIYEQFLPKALEVGRYKITPGTGVAGGLGSLRAGLEAGKKIVVKF
ncbi:hypothetical protein F4860DRAFT_392215 [Xylaria cubensis]|nr:hypothetical protein F4860DRAFT_392215 [Xylaria cubensis]